MVSVIRLCFVLLHGWRYILRLGEPGEVFLFWDCFVVLNTILNLIFWHRLWITVTQIAFAHAYSKQCLKTETASFHLFFGAEGFTSDLLRELVQRCTKVSV